jgi:hypothetical protein
MKKFILNVILIFIIQTNTIAQNPGPNVVWQKCFSTSGKDIFQSVIEIPSGGYYATAEFENTDYFLQNDTTGGYYLLKFDENFNVIWKRFIPMLANKIIIESNGDIVLGGITNRYINKGNVFKDIHGTDLYFLDLAILKLDSTGQHVKWAHAYGSTGEERELFDLIATESGYIFSGTTRGSNGDIPGNRPCFNPFRIDAVFMKIDTFGILQWVKMITGSTSDGPTGSIVKLENNHYRLDITSNSSDCDFAGTLPFDFNKKNYRLLSIIIDENGNELKRKIDETGKLTQYFAKTWKHGSKTYGVGYTYADIAYVPTFPSHKDAEGLVVEFDDSLNMIRQKLFGGNGYDFFFDHIYDSDYNHIFFGATASSDNSGDVKNYKGGSSDLWIVKTDTNFNVIWSRTVGSVGMDSYLYYNYPYNKMIIRGSELILLYAIYPPAQIPNGDVECGLFTFNSGDSTRQYSDAWIVAFDLSTGINVQQEKEIAQFKLYPNPTNNIVTIQNASPSSKEFKLRIIDQLGRLTKEIKYIDSLEYDITISDLPEGMYYFNVFKNRKQLYSQKIIIKK